MWEFYGVFILETTGWGQSRVTFIYLKFWYARSIEIFSIVREAPLQLHSHLNDLTLVLLDNFENVHRLTSRRHCLSCSIILPLIFLLLFLTFSIISVFYLLHFTYQISKLYNISPMPCFDMTRLYLIAIPSFTIGSVCNNLVPIKHLW